MLFPSHLKPWHAELHRLQSLGTAAAAVQTMAGAQTRPFPVLTQHLSGCPNAHQLIAAKCPWEPHTHVWGLFFPNSVLNKKQPGPR